MTTPYLVLARKYRPQRFADLTGQEHVVRTLANALRTGRVAHAFLFTGPRGCGKTTSARILARALDRGPGTRLKTLPLLPSGPGGFTTRRRPIPGPAPAGAERTVYHESSPIRDRGR